MVTASAKIYTIKELRTRRVAKALTRLLDRHKMSPETLGLDALEKLIIREISSREGLLQ